MQRFSVATWMLGAALAAGLLPGCADVIAEQGGVSADPRGASAPVRVDARADRRAYYAYSRSVWAICATGSVLLGTPLGDTTPSVISRRSR